MNCTAHLTGDKLEIWGGFQDGLGARATAAKVAGLPFANVTLHHTAMGGGFGRRGFDAELPGRRRSRSRSRSTRPVNMIWSREEDMTQDNYRQASVARMKAGLDANGRPIAWLHEFTEKHDPEDATWIAYGIADRAARYVNGTDPIPFGPWRSVDNSHHGFFIESFVDELALRGQARSVRVPPRPAGRRAASPRGVGGRGAGCRAGERRSPKGRGARHLAEGVVRHDRRAGRRGQRRRRRPRARRPRLVRGRSRARSCTRRLHGADRGRDHLRAHGRALRRDLDRQGPRGREELPRLPDGADGRRAGDRGADHRRRARRPAARASPARRRSRRPLANAIFAATGKRIRSLPLRKHDLSAPPEPGWRPEKGSNEEAT